MRRTLQQPPKRSQRSVTPEQRVAAEELIKSQDLSTVKYEDIRTTIQALNAVRHQAMISDKKDVIKKADFLIASLNIMKNQPKPVESASNSSSPKVVYTKSSSSPDVELTDQDRDLMNQVVDLLIEGNEIDKIEPEVIPKLQVVLKERQNALITDGEYDKAKICEQHLEFLSTLNTRSIEASQTGLLSMKGIRQQRQTEMLNNYVSRIEDAEARIEQLKESKEDILSKINVERENSQNQIYREFEEIENAFQIEKEDYESGIGYKASRKLLELRAIEKRLAKASLFDEAAAARRKADKVEIEERKEYNRRVQRIIHNKENQIKKAKEERDQIDAQYWESRIQKTEETFEAKIKRTEVEIENLKDKIEKSTNMTYEEYMKIRNEQLEEEEEQNGQTEEPNEQVPEQEETNKEQIEQTEQVNQTEEQVEEQQNESSLIPEEQNENEEPVEEQKEENEIPIDEQLLEEENEIPIDEQLLEEESENPEKIEAPAETPTEESGETPAEETKDEQTEEVKEEPAEEAKEETTETPVEEQTEAPAETPAEEAKEEPAEKAEENQIEEPSGEPAEGQVEPAANEEEPAAPEE